MKKGKSFINHRINGVYLEFPNGNSLSTIWGRGSYSENHDFTCGDIVADYSTPIETGSNNVEIMIDTQDIKLHNKIFRKFHTNKDNGVIGWLDMNDWLWVVRQLAGK